MCQDCGCQIANKEAFSHKPENHGHDHHHDHDHHHHDHDHHHHDHDHHHHDHGKSIKTTVDVAIDVLKKNNLLAEKNRVYFTKNKILTLNIISSPGSGKTLLLEKTVNLLSKSLKVAVIIGDQEKDFDAQRIKKAGGHVLQLNTYSSCHLDASMINSQLDKFITKDLDLLIIENVGNLVCPAAFDLGETSKIAVLSTPEGEEKPVKYPVLFNKADIILINKIDLAPHLDWDREKCHAHIKQVNNTAKVLEISAKTNQGLTPWIEYLSSNFKTYRENLSTPL